MSVPARHARAAAIPVAVVAALALRPGPSRADGAEVLPVPPPTAAAAAEATEQAAQQGELRLRLLEAQLFLLTGRLVEAEAAYALLRDEAPTSAEPLAGLGAVARETGRPRLSRAHYRDALARDPGNLPAAQALAALERDRAPRLRADVEQRFQRNGVGSDSADITVGEVGAQWAAGDAWRLSVALGAAYVTASGVRLANGAVGDFSGWRTRTELSAQYEAMQGESVTFSVFANEWALGAGVVGRLPDADGSTALRAEYHRPIWDFVEAIIEGATRDRLAVERVQRFAPEVTGRLELGLNNYGIPRDEDDLLQSFTARAELRRSDIGGVAGLSIAYVLDAEWVLSETDRVDAAGAPYAPLPIVDRAVNAALIGYGGEQGSIETGRLTYQASLGYGVDLYGRAGPLAFLSAGYAIGRLEASLRAGYVRNIGRAQGETAFLGASMQWVF